MENSTHKSESNVSIYKVVPSAITIIGMCFGLTSIRMSLEGFHELAASLILLAAVADGLDGLAARQLNAVSKFGAELDSLTDFWCFGVAPSILLYCMFTNELGSLAGARRWFLWRPAVCDWHDLMPFNKAVRTQKTMMGKILIPVQTPKNPKHILSAFRHLVGHCWYCSRLLILPDRQHQCFTLSGSGMALHYWDIDDFAPENVFAKNNSHS